MTEQLIELSSAESRLMGRHALPNRRPITLGSSVLQHPGIVAVCTVALLLAGLVAGTMQKPTYTSSARLVVGSISAPADSVPGIVEANRQLAGIYARLVDTQGVIDAGRNGAPAAPGGVFATPIAETSMIIVTGSSDSAAHAKQVTQQRAEGLRAYVAQINGGNQGVTSLLDQYTQATKDNAAAQQAVSTYKSGTPEYAAAQARVSSTKLTMDTLADRYAKAATASDTSGVLTLISNADYAASNKKALVKKDGALGLVAGLVLGCGLAVAATARKRRKHEAISV